MLIYYFFLFFNLHYFIIKSINLIKFNFLLFVSNDKKLAFFHLQWSFSRRILSNESIIYFFLLFLNSLHHIFLQLYNILLHIFQPPLIFFWQHPIHLTLQLFNPFLQNLTFTLRLYQSILILRVFINKLLLISNMWLCSL